MNKVEIREKNVAKYGSKEDDVISRAYREGKNIGDVWCLKNAEKYMRRFLSSSEKGNNLADLIKAQDYLNRAIEFNQNVVDINKDEVIEKYDFVPVDETPFIPPAHFQDIEFSNSKAKKDDGNSKKDY